MIVVAMSVLVIAVVLALVWTMQRRMMYFPIGHQNDYELLAGQEMIQGIVRFLHEVT